MENFNQCKECGHAMLNENFIVKGKKICGICYKLYVEGYLNIN